jgi:outer membrane protein assembly factor BamB
LGISPAPLLHCRLLAKLQKKKMDVRGFMDMILRMAPTHPSPFFTPATLSLFLAFNLQVLAGNGDWPQRRGPQDNGSTQAQNIPTSWDDSDIAWKVELPGKGCSTPIVSGKRIFVTAPVGGNDAVLAYDWEGKLLWQTELSAETPGKHRNASGSNPSPVTDGKLIFVTFKSGNFAALNVDGSIRWQKNLVSLFGPVNLFWDFGTSPVLTEKHVVMARMHGGESWLAAFDKENGEMRWKTDRTYATPREVDNGYTTPQVILHEGTEALLTWGAEHLTIHDAAKGNLLWSCGDFNPAATPLWPAVASSVVVDGMALVCFGRADKGAPILHGIKLGGSGDVTAKNRVWLRNDVGAFVPTPVEYKGRVYVLSDRGQIDCVDPITGKSDWTESLPRSSSNFYGSPTIAGGVMYAPREDGTVFVVQVENGFRVLAEKRFEDRIIASVVPVENRLFVRGQTHLYCISRPR